MQTPPQAGFVRRSSWLSTLGEDPFGRADRFRLWRHRLHCRRGSRPFKLGVENKRVRPTLTRKPLIFHDIFMRLRLPCRQDQAFRLPWVLWNRYCESRRGLLREAIIRSRQLEAILIQTFIFPYPMKIPAA